MNELIGFGSPWVTALWAVSLAAALAWLGRELLLGRLVTIPSFVVGLSFLAPLLVQYPFTFSPINILATGTRGFSRYPVHVDAAFLISLVGMVSFVVGFLIPIRVRDTFAPAAFVSAGVRIWAQKVFLYISLAVTIAAFAAMFLLGMLGAGGARAGAMMLPALRPLYNIVHTILPLLIALTLAVGWQRRRRFILLMAAVEISLAVLTGTRAAVLGGILLFAVAVLCRRSLSTGLSGSMAVRVIVMAAVLLVAAIYMGDVRRGQYNPLLSIAGIGVHLFYGNTFSDLRDFAWVHAYWNGTYLWGKTELAGLLAFAPSAMIPFRQDWGWGVVSTTWTGLNSKVHPGLRPGSFGELYFNFGIPGVVVGGLLFGYIARRLHAVTQRAARLPDVHTATLEIIAAFATLGLVKSFLITAGFFEVYVVVLTLLALQIMAAVARGSAQLLDTGRYASVGPIPSTHDP
ncbi:MAG TPA: O-antigen polymerase [Gemmatimonadaceae bacterium]|nr:O-antigen polymerase [Gemmatimonadaceae bacterium]